MTTETPSIYVACLAAYHYGHLHGEWIALEEETIPEDLQKQIEAMLKTSPIEGAEEWEIQDSENFAGFESTNLSLLCQVAAAIHQHGEEPIRGYLGHRGQDADLEEFEDRYLGEYESKVDFCQEHFWIDETTEIAGMKLSAYIDWDAIARDVFINDYYAHEANGKAYIYYRR